MISLLIILLLVLILPFTVKLVERNLELFLMVMGLTAALVSGVLDADLVKKALRDPIGISLTVLAAGIFFMWVQRPLERAVSKLTAIIPIRLLLAALVIILGLVSSIITAIIASLVLVAIVSVVQLDRKAKIHFVIIACYAIGLGASLTPIGEPLSTITISKLNEEFGYLFKLLGLDVLTCLLILGWLTVVMVNPKEEERQSVVSMESSYADSVIRAIKVYVFIMGLTFFGHGFQPMIDRYIIGLDPQFLYWVNMISAVLDNATLTAAEISPAMDELTIRAILMGLLISGGMLIPGNIPNIIAAGKLNITSKEWAKFGLPLGLILMLFYYFIIFLYT